MKAARPQATRIGVNDFARSLCGIGDKVFITHVADRRNVAKFLGKTPIDALSQARTQELKSRHAGELWPVPGAGCTLKPVHSR